MPDFHLPRRGSRGVGALLAVGGLLWLASPIALLVVLTIQSTAVELTPDKPVWVAVEPNAGQVSEAVEITLEWQPASPLVAPAWSGLVQSVGVSAGTVLESGHPVAVIDGVTRIAHHSVSPFYRPLAVGDTGPDAAELNALLAAQGLEHTPGDRVTRATLGGVRSFATSLGLPATSPLRAFDPAWIVYLSSAQVDVRSVDLVIGAPAPAPGTVIAELDERLASASLVSAGEASGSVAAQAGQSLSVAGHELALAEDRQHVSDLSQLRELVADDAGSVAGRLSRHPGPNEWVVPAAAVFAGPDGGLCVVTGGPAHPGTLPVAVVGGELGRAIVTGELDTGDRVSVRPAAELRRCE